MDGGTIAYSETLYTDKRTEENDGAGASVHGFNNESLRSRSFWQKGTLIRQFIFGVSLDRSTHNLDKMKYSLSDDANDLIITTELQPKSLIPEPTAGPQSTTRSFAAIEQRRVFHRK